MNHYEFPTITKVKENIEIYTSQFNRLNRFSPKTGEIILSFSQNKELYKIIRSSCTILKYIYYLAGIQKASRIDRMEQIKIKRLDHAQEELKKKNNLTGCLYGWDLFLYSTISSNWIPINANIQLNKTDENLFVTIPESAIYMACLIEMTFLKIKIRNMKALYQEMRRC